MVAVTELVEQLSTSHRVEGLILGSSCHIRIDVSWPATLQLCPQCVSVNG